MGLFGLKDGYGQGSPEIIDESVIVFDD